MFETIVGGAFGFLLYLTINFTVFSNCVSVVT
jgi:hypothetical protein